MLGRAAIVNPELILALIQVPECGDLGGLCRTRAAACEQSGVTTTLDVADKPAILRGAFGWWGGRLGPVRAVIGLVGPLAGIASGAY